MACTARVEAGKPLADALTQGGVVCLGPGVHVGPLVLTKSVTLRGEAGAVLDGRGEGSVVRVEDDELVVRIEALTLRGGSDEAGGGLALTGYSEVTLQGCVLEGNRAKGRGDTRGGGGGVYASRGTLRVENGTFKANRAAFGSDLFVTGVAEVTVVGGVLSGDVSVREGASVAIEGARIDGTLDARGTTTRAPTVRLRGPAPAGGLRNDPQLPAKVEVLP